MGQKFLISKTDVIFLKIMSWSVISGLVVFTVVMYRLMAEAVGPNSGFGCANGVTGPLSGILNFGVPAGYAAVGMLGIFWCYRLATAWAVFKASLLVLACTFSLLVLGIWFFRYALPGFYLSDTVWWMKPAGRLFGV